jgi:hypothetical protein
MCRAIFLYQRTKRRKGHGAITLQVVNDRVTNRRVLGLVDMKALLRRLRMNGQEQSVCTAFKTVCAAKLRSSTGQGESRRRPGGGKTG